MGDNREIEPSGDLNQHPSVEPSPANRLHPDTHTQPHSLTHPHRIFTDTRTAPQGPTSSNFHLPGSIHHLSPLSVSHRHTLSLKATHRLQTHTNSNSTWPHSTSDPTLTLTWAPAPFSLIPSSLRWLLCFILIFTPPALLNPHIRMNHFTWILSYTHAHAHTHILKINTCSRPYLRKNTQ